MASTRRNRVALNGGLKCHYCGFITWVSSQHKAEVEKTFPAKIAPGKHRNKAINARMFTVDHIIPQADGGSDDGENTAPSCFLCNNMKGSAPEHQFRALVNYLLQREAHPHQLFLRTGIWFNCEFIAVRSIKAKKDK